MKTSQLTGAALDWAVAKCKYPKLVWGSSIGIHHASHQIVIPHLPEPRCYWNPSTNWSQGGPIIEREWLDLTPWPNESREDMWWHCQQHDSGGDCAQYGPTPLIAAMRCYVASKLGDNVELPEGIA